MSLRDKCRLYGTLLCALGIIVALASYEYKGDYQTIGFEVSIALLIPSGICYIIRKATQ